MKEIQEYIDSGILEAYVLGIATPGEKKDIEEMARQHAEIREAIETFESDLEKFAMVNAVTPDPTIKPLLIATIDYIERMRKGEKPSYPQMLNKNSAIKDYEEWLNNKDMQLPDNFSDFYVKIISRTPKALTAIVWIKYATPWEVHDDEFENFLIVEGTCNIIIENEIHQLKAGDYLSIPLYKKHTVEVTSPIPCKAILQRVAA